jgi:Sporulation protein YtrH
MEFKQAFIPLLITSYFIALGVILGGSLLGGFASFLIGDPPFYWLSRFSDSLRIWAIVAAIGGTFDAFYSFERGIFAGDMKEIVKQILLILFAMGGAQTGAIILKWLVQESG